MNYPWVMDLRTGFEQRNYFSNIDYNLKQCFVTNKFLEVLSIDGYIVGKRKHPRFQIFQKSNGFNQLVSESCCS